MAARQAAELEDRAVIVKSSVNEGTGLMQVNSGAAAGIEYSAPQ
jgi:hypothetical protein